MAKPRKYSLDLLGKAADYYFANDNITMDCSCKKHKVNINSLMYYIKKNNIIPKQNVRFIYKNKPDLGFSVNRIANPIEDLEKKIEIEQLTIAMSKLKKKRFKAIWLRWGFKTGNMMTQKEVGEILGIGGSGVFYLEGRAIKDIKNFFETQDANDNYEVEQMSMR